jgi:hypothetical protein
MPLSARHRRTLEAIFQEPVPANLPWREIEQLFIALSGEVREGRGSRVRVRLGETRAVFHRPHPGNEAPRRLVRQVRDFLRAADKTLEG